MLGEKQAYEGFGAGGKFRDAPFRRTTPYYRPPTTLRNPSAAASGGWLSKLVDPAHRLISSVFRKRLPPPPQSTSTGSINPLGFPKAPIDQIEQVLEQKTFTRSEIDRLTALLNSRIIDSIPVENNQEKKTSEVVMFPSKSVVSPSIFGFRAQSRNQDSSPTLFRSGVPTLPSKARGRSAIYRMAQTPYARIRTTAGLKRRFSVLDDNAMGSAGGPIRKVRRKPNLSPSGGSGSEAAPEDPSLSLILKPVPKHQASSENGGNAIPRASSVMGHKLLEQIDIVGSSTVPDSSKLLDVSVDDHLVPEDRDETCEIRDKVKENGPAMIDVPSDSSLIMEGVDSRTEKEDEPVVNVATEVAVSASPSKSAFKMSAHDDDFALVEDDDSDDETNELVASDSNSFCGVSTACVTLDQKPPPVISENINSRISIFPSSVASSSITADLSTPVATQPADFIFDKVTPPMSNVGINSVTSADSEAGSPLFTSTVKAVDDKVPAVAKSVDDNVGAFSHPKLPESSRCSVSPVIADTTNMLPKPLDLESDKAADNKNVNTNSGGFSFAVPSAISPAPSTTDRTAKLNTESSLQLSPAVAPSVFNNFSSPSSSSTSTLTSGTSSAVNSIATETAVSANSTNTTTSTTISAPTDFGGFSTVATTSGTAIGFGGSLAAATSTYSEPIGFGGSSPASTISTITSVPIDFGGSSTATANNVFGSSICSSTSTKSASLSVPSLPAFGASNPAFSFTSSAPFGGSSVVATNIVFGSSTFSSTNINSAPLFPGSSNAASSTSTFPFPSLATNSIPSLPAFGTSNPAFTFTSSAPLGGSSTAATNNVFGSSPFSCTSNSAPLFPGSSIVASSASTLPFTSPAINSVPSVPAFGYPNPAFSFTSSSSTDHTSTTLAFPVLGQQTVPLGNPFQFASQQNVANSQVNPSPFQGSDSFGKYLGNGFSVGSSGGDDKNKRRYFKPKPTRSRK